ncbi:MAG TPA: adenylosuccinate lyase [Candidatus Marinimicrobia bacterium]|nr:adenylosuccinate lyase [Candidatus Neomarinimicrobiota bacterium]MEE1505875.1 adenylosuccinate lyase [Candidatus Neomarinimicrobiota bacterium]MEE1572530.1 adenylosuccinate lyase [Candidatus Neomarinimicrobiota bacterium]HJL78409.1 adenylosuccinate lyase [Candidatus Neomarinimicrobiota bacterium]HJN68434.1 adenylosuccinate lyase [Candidatus Neomarinimicrobiota bacterium]
MSELKNISPLDGRYANSVKDLSVYFSESALMGYRLKMEIEYLIAMGNEKSIKELPVFSKEEQSHLRKIYQSFNTVGAKKVKQIEATTNHDVKAIEYYIQSKVKKALHPWIHFALTSEDVNNLSYSLMWQGGLKQAYLPALRSVNKELKKLAQKYKNATMLALTHGQPATPTTFGKELAVFCARLDRQVDQIKSHKLLGKFGGATGTWSAHKAAYPKMNWIHFASKFIKSLGLEPNLITTQIEPHDSVAESYHQVVRVNSILTDLCRDMWAYISRGILGQKKVTGEVGSSTMPHKINPIQFENAEGNLCLSSNLLAHLATKLTISRMQRDLSDSTTLRNQGVALGYSYLALQNISKGLGRITVDKSKLTQELDNHWEVLAEAIQTILRKSGNPDAYEQLKEIVRGQSTTPEVISGFVSTLKISDADKKVLMNLTPESYIGLAPKLVDLI